MVRRIGIASALLIAAAAAWACHEVTGVDASAPDASASAVPSQAASEAVMPPVAAPIHGRPPERMGIVYPSPGDAGTFLGSKGPTSIPQWLAVPNTLPTDAGIGQSIVYTDAGWVPSTGVPPSGTAGGDLTGTYPDPQVAQISSTGVVPLGNSTTNLELQQVTSTGATAPTLVLESSTGLAAASGDNAGLLEVLGGAGGNATSTTGAGGNGAEVYLLGGAGGNGGSASGNAGTGANVVLQPGPHGTCTGCSVQTNGAFVEMTTGDTAAEIFQLGGRSTDYMSFSIPTTVATAGYLRFPDTTENLIEYSTSNYALLSVDSSHDVIVDSHAALELGNALATSVTVGNNSVTTAVTQKVDSSGAIENVVGSTTVLIQGSTSSDLALFGASGSTHEILPTGETFAAGVTSPTIQQLQAGNAATPQNLAIKAQYPGSSCGSTAECTPGSINLELGAPGATGSPNEGFFNVVRNGTIIMAIGADPGTAGDDVGIYFGAAASSPGNSNWNFLGSNSQVYLNAPQQLLLGADTNYIIFDGTVSPANLGAYPSTTLNLGNATTPWNEFFLSNIIQYNAAASSPGIRISTPTSDVATTPLTFVTQGAYASASSNKTSSNFVVQSGAPATGGAQGGIQVNDNAGVGMVYLGDYGMAGGGSGTQGAIWFAGAPTYTNFGFIGDQSETMLNAPSGAVVYVTTGGTAANGVNVSANYLGPNNASVTVGAAATPFASTFVGGSASDTASTSYREFVSFGGTQTTAPSSGASQQGLILERGYYATQSSTGTVSIASGTAGSQFCPVTGSHVAVDVKWSVRGASDFTKNAFGEVVNDCYNSSGTSTCGTGVSVFSTISNGTGLCQTDGPVPPTMTIVAGSSGCWIIESTCDTSFNFGNLLFTLDIYSVNN